MVNRSTDVVSADIDFRQPEKFVAFRRCLNDFFEREIHPSVTVHQMAIQGFAILEFYKHGMSLRGRQET